MLLSEPFDPNASARERILHCACQLFYQDGIRATGIDKIIAQAGVTKVTFYRHFPAKKALVLAFLQRRHTHWMEGFSQTLSDALQQNPASDALSLALESWFRQPDFRGCAFINAATELAGSWPEASDQVLQHKRAMRDEIKRQLVVLSSGEAEMAAMLVDGAIVQVQMGTNVTQVVASLKAGLRTLVTRQ